MSPSKKGQESSKLQADQDRSFVVIEDAVLLVTGQPGGHSAKGVSSSRRCAASALGAPPLLITLLPLPLSIVNKYLEELRSCVYKLLEQNSTPVNTEAVSNG